MARKAEAAAKNSDLSTVYRIMKELGGGRKLIDDPSGGLNGQLLVCGDEQLKRRNKHFTTVLNHITSDEPLPIVNEMTSHLQTK